MSLPPEYEARAATLRIERGLVGLGASEALAEWAAATAIAEAPFGPVTEEGWAEVSRRARELAAGDDELDEDGYGLYPARFRGKVGA